MFLWPGLPVQDDRNRRVGFLCDSGDQKPLAIRRHHVLMTGIALLHRAAEPGSEQGDRRADFGELSVSRDSECNSLEPAIQGDVEQFLAITSPTYLAAAAG
jgi:hypothetical protein